MLALSKPSCVEKERGRRGEESQHARGKLTWPMMVVVASRMRGFGLKGNDDGERNRKETLAGRVREKCKSLLVVIGRS